VEKQAIFCPVVFCIRTAGGDLNRLSFKTRYSRIYGQKPLLKYGNGN